MAKGGLVSGGRKVAWQVMVVGAPSMWYMYIVWSRCLCMFIVIFFFLKYNIDCIVIIIMFFYM